MFGDILRSIGGVSVFPVISLLLFVSFFAGVLIRVARMDRRLVDRLSRLPLAGDDAVTEEVQP